MIVVDSSVWINFIRAVRTRAALGLRERLDPTRIIVGDLVLSEVLQGCRDDRDVRNTERLLSQFSAEEMVGIPIARQAAANFRTLRRRGVTIRSTIDVMIATYCIDRNYQLLTEDRDFAPMAQHLGLRLA